INEDEIGRWFAEMDYDRRFPDYIRTYPSPELRQKKALEHCLSLELCLFSEGDIVLYVIGATSPFCRVCKETSPKVKTYHLDLPRPEYGLAVGIHGEYIGASADDIPLEAGGVSRIYSHNAIEHFEDGVYFRFFQEAARVLA